jgi:4-hydroxybenzoate polyprenyltransferase
MKKHSRLLKILNSFVLLMLHFIKLTRPVNLLVIILTMYVMYALFLKCTLPGVLLSSDDLNFTLAIFYNPYFALLVLSTTFVAASGNIINDYFDVKIDRINKPEKLIVDRFIVKRKAILFHTILNFVAVLIGVLLWWITGSFWPLLFHLATTSGLWTYSGVLKRKFLSGNITVAILTAMVPLLVYLYVRDTIGYFDKGHELAFHTMGYFALFAFFTTLIREIQKDFADMKGDSMYNCKTVPLYLGIRKGRGILFAIFGLTLFTFIVLFVLIAKVNSLNITFFIVVNLLFLISFAQSLKAIKRKSWVNAAATMKLVMITALLFFAIKLYA